MPSPESVPADAGTTDRADATPSLWTRKRKILASLLGLHWLCVLCYALPDSSLKDAILSIEVPVPVLCTQEGHAGLQMQTMSPISAYLEISNLRQEWVMFTHIGPEDHFRFALGIEHLNGTRELVLLSDTERYWMGRWCRRRYAERLLNQPRSQSVVPDVGRGFARAHLEGRTVKSVHFLRFGSPRVLVEEDGTDAPIFTSGAEFEARMADPRQWAIMGDVELDLTADSREQP